MEEHPQARFIVETLSKAGFVAYYAGGWVRDYLLQHPSDDIDIATNAPPETIQTLFPHTVPIGISFGIILVVIDGHPYEVATFRQDLDYKDGRRPSRIEFTTAEEDAQRRDFTINGLFYDPLKEEILDFVNGKADLEKKLIRAIGNPIERIKEDRLRMVRAVRLSCRFGFAIEEKTKEAIIQEAHHLRPAVAIERICQEFMKAKNFGKLHPTLLKMHRFGLLSPIFPSLKNVSENEMEKRLLPLQFYPDEAPLIASLILLFAHATLEEEIALCKELKLSKKEEKFLIALSQGKKLLEKEGETNYELAKFYADPASESILQIVSAHRKDREVFLTKERKRILHLQPFITRIQEHNPLVSSEILFREGIPSGKTMGLLLTEAEKLSINEELQDPLLVIERLKKSPLWPR